MVSTRTTERASKVGGGRQGGAVVVRSPAGKARSEFHVTVGTEVFKSLSPHPAAVQKIAEALGRVLHRNEKSGEAGGFTFKVDGAGKFEIEPLADVRPASGGVSEAERTEHAFEAARERGRIRAAQVLDQADMLSADAFADRLGVSRVTVNARRQKNELLGLDGAKRGFRFPEWQVDEDGKAFDALPRLFEILGPSPWGVYRFLTQRHNVLNGSTAKDALRRGHKQQVIDAAESIARGDFS